MSRKVRKDKKWQVGNFFVSQIEIGVGMGQRIDAFIITDNERNWKVQIPQHWGSFSLIKELLDGGEKSDYDILGTVFTNMHCVACVLDGKYQLGVFNEGVKYIERMSKEKPEIDDEYNESIIRFGEINEDIKKELGE